MKEDQRGGGRKGEDAPSSTAMVRRLGLGTAQFGLDYGITNAAGKVAAEEVRRILAFAAMVGIDLLDTACLYGDCERIIGACLRPHQVTKIVTKTPRFGDLSEPVAAAERLSAAFHQSLSRLGQSAVYGLLVHDANDLLGYSGEAVWSMMQQLQRAGLVEKIGVSVYSGQQIEALVPRYQLDVMQIPLNAVDGRLKRSEILKQLAERGIELHARSVFLQGLLVAPPATIAPRFGALKDAVTRMAQDCATHGLTQIDAALAAVLAHTEVARVIVGVTTVDELRAVVTAAARATGVCETVDLRSWEIADDDVLNPVTWSTQTRA